jgi:selT/selW/selH-like putative selenoprotein
LVKGSAGVFDITIDGALVYSKKKTGRFPTDEEVRALVSH